MNKTNIKHITKKYLIELYSIKEQNSILQNLMGKFIDDKDSVFNKEYSEKITKSLENYLKEKNKTEEDLTDEDLSNIKIVGDIDLSSGGFNSEQKKIIKLLIDEMTEMGITNPYTQIGMLSVISKESNFIPKSEIDYCTTSNTRIRKIFGSRVPSSDSELNSLKCDPRKFFNQVYSKTVGNQGGDDGWMYRGRGLNQLTGIKNYEKYGRMIGLGDRLVEDPELVNDPEIAIKIALAFFTKGKSASSIPEFDNKEDAAIYFADINAGGGASSHRNHAIAASKKFDVEFDIT